MKATSEEEELTRWIDGEYADRDAAAASRPGWTEEREAALALGKAMRASVSAERELPHADFFQHQLRRRIEGGGVFATDEGEAAAPRRSGGRSGDAAQGFPLFVRLRWLSALGFAACLAGVALVAWNGTRDAGERSEVVHAYAPDPEVVVSTAYDADAGATVIRLTGVRPLPADRMLFPSVPGPDSGRRLLFSIDARDMGGPASVYSGGRGDEFPGAMLVGF